MTRKMNTYFNSTNDIINNGHSANEYADKQKEDSLKRVSKIDVEGFMEKVKNERCVVEIRGGNNARTKTELDKDKVYTIWFNEANGKWMHTATNLVIGGER